MRVRAEFRAKHLSDTIFFPGLRKLPFPVQNLCLGQLEIAQERMGDGENCNPLTDEVFCTCLFFASIHFPALVFGIRNLPLG
jgi:hypothetical protein